MWFGKFLQETLHGRKGLQEILKGKAESEEVARRYLIITDEFHGSCSDELISSIELGRPTS